jgi:ferredoxin
LRRWPGDVGMTEEREERPLGIARAVIQFNFECAGCFGCIESCHKGAALARLDDDLTVWRRKAIAGAIEPSQDQSPVSGILNFESR